MTDQASSLQERKQQLVQETIWDTAIEVFTERGFDATTVEEIALAAGVSRRSFFRYFASKDHLLGGGIILFGQALSQAVAKAPEGLSPFEVLRHTVTVVAQQVSALPRSKKIIALSETSMAAKQALRSRLPEAEVMLVKAYATRLPGTATAKQLQARMLASLTFTLVDLILSTWMKEDPLEISAAIAIVYESFGTLVSEANGRLAKPIGNAD
jgi:AcrR family transcriptional regulator